MVTVWIVQTNIAHIYPYFQISFCHLFELQKYISALRNKSVQLIILSEWTCIFQPSNMIWLCLYSKACAGLNPFWFFSRDYHIIDMRNLQLLRFLVWMAIKFILFHRASLTILVDSLQIRKNSKLHYIAMIKFKCMHSNV